MDKLTDGSSYRYEYELLVYQGVELKDSSTPIIRRTAKEPPITLNPDELGGEPAAGKKFTMGVRLKSPEVSVNDFKLTPTEKKS